MDPELLEMLRQLEYVANSRERPPSERLALIAEIAAKAIVKAEGGDDRVTDAPEIQLTLDVWQALDGVRSRLEHLLDDSEDGGEIGRELRELHTHIGAVIRKAEGGA